jgi:hypothetical protein
VGNRLGLAADAGHMHEGAMPLVWRQGKMARSVRVCSKMSEEEERKKEMRLTSGPHKSQVFGHTFDVSKF